MQRVQQYKILLQCRRKQVMIFENSKIIDNDNESGKIFTIITVSIIRIKVKLTLKI